MEKNKYMKHFMIFVTVALIVSVFVNFNLLSRVEQMEHTLDHLSFTQRNMIHDINSQTEHIRHVLNEFIEEESWISSIDWQADFESMGEAQTMLTFTWQVNELPANAEVDFHYAFDDQDGFASLPAEEIAQGFFQAQIPFEVNLAPQWEVIWQHRDSSEEKMAEKPTSESALKYFVSVKTDDSVRSSNIQTEYLGHNIGADVYGLIITNIHSYDYDGFFSINMMHHQATEKIEEVSLLTYEQSKLISEQDIESDQQVKADDSRLQIFQSNKLELHEQFRYVIKARYSDGKTFEKEI